MGRIQVDPYNNVRTMYTLTTKLGYQKLLPLHCWCKYNFRNAGHFIARVETS